MTGQESVNVAKEFNERLEITGVIVTKLDGDTRGGAALSIKAVTDVPIKLMSTGEHLDELEVFHPERMAERILGMGDVLTLIEKAEEAVTEEQAKKMEKKFKRQYRERDEITKLKISNSLRNRKKSASHCQAISQGLKNY